jgi:hypothetical protein
MSACLGPFHPVQTFYQFDSLICQRRISLASPFIIPSMHSSIGITSSFTASSRAAGAACPLHVFAFTDYHSSKSSE